jgi:hypothetical protein
MEQLSLIGKYQKCEYRKIICIKITTLLPLGIAGWETDNLFRSVSVFYFVLP